MVTAIAGLWVKIEKLIVADLEYHYTIKVPEKERWFLDRVTVKNTVTATTECLVGVEMAGTLFPLYLFYNIVAGNETDYQLQTWLFPGERFFWYWYNVTAADPVTMVLTGHRKID